MADDALKISVPLQARDRRGAERFVATMPVSVDGLEGTTNDLSATGLSFMADRSYEPGAHIQVTIEYLLDGHKYPLECEAEVVRVDPVDGGYRIGARLSPQSQMQDMAVPADPPRHLRPIE
jgi:hypothetical protein